MGNKFQRYALIIIIVLVVLSIAAKFFYNQKVNSIAWDDDDREILVNDCIDDLAHYAVRFPSLAMEYCDCSTDSIMLNVKKAEYLQIRTKSKVEQQRALMPFMSGCFNRFQKGMFDATELGDIDL